MAIPAALLAAALVGSVVTLAGRSNPARASNRPGPLSTAPVSSGPIWPPASSREAHSGTRPPTRSSTTSPGPTPRSLPLGPPIEPGQPLYRVDNCPIVLMIGSTPAYRAFGPGMTDGPDVAQLESNLITLGDAHGLFSTPSGHFSTLTDDAVKRWQTANGYTADGHIPLGTIVFLPTAVLGRGTDRGLRASRPLRETPPTRSRRRRLVYVPLNPDLPTVSVGEPVPIVLPTNAQTPGRVTAVGPPPPNLASSSSSSSGSGTGGSSSSTTTVLTVTPQDPAATGTGDGVGVQVSLTIQRARDVLAVPVSALLALAGGGYGVEIGDLVWGRTGSQASPLGSSPAGASRSQDGASLQGSRSWWRSERPRTRCSDQGTPRHSPGGRPRRRYSDHRPG